MVSADYLLIGGGIASYSAAKKILRTQPSANVLMISNDPLPPYDLPPLSKDFLLGRKSVPDIVFPELRGGATPNLEIRLNTVVESIDIDSRTAGLDDGARIHFRQALLAPGASPIRLNVPGGFLPGVHYLRTAADSAAIAADAGRSRRAVIIGAGFIGLETACSLRQMGVEVTVVEAAPRIWSRFADAGLAMFVQGYCESEGIAFRTGALVNEIRGDRKVEGVATAAGDVFPCEMVCIGVGVRPNLDLATAAGLAVGDGIHVDEHMQTSAPGVYAAGDAVNYFDPVANRRRRAEHWGHAEYSGQVAGANMAGGSLNYDFMNYAWSDLFDLHFEFAGDENGHDRVLVRGSPADRRFICLYLRSGALRAFCAVNADPQEFAMLRKMIRSAQDLSGLTSELQDPSVALRSLI